MTSSRRDRERAKQKRERARQYARENDRHDVLPSEHGITHLDPNDPPESAHLYARSSSGEQNPTPQLSCMKRLCRECGTSVLGCARETASGKSLAPADRPILFKLLRKAQGGIVLAMDITRFLRPEDYHPWKEPSAKLTGDDLALLQRLAKKFNVIFATINDPDASPEEGRAIVQKANDESSKAGRPRKNIPGHCKARKEKYLTLTRRLRDRGWSLRRIAGIVLRECKRAISHVTIFHWLR